MDLGQTCINVSPTLHIPRSPLIEQQLPRKFFTADNRIAERKVLFNPNSLS